MKHQRLVPALFAASALAACTSMAPGDTPAEPAATKPVQRAAKPGPAATELRISPGDDASAQRGSELLASGHAAVTPDQLGFFVDVQTADLRRRLAGSGVMVDRLSQGILITFPGEAAFDYASAKLSASMTPALEAIARVLDEYRASVLVVTGHSDNQGTSSERNQSVSERRALAVGQRLLELGIKPERLVIQGLGPDRPVASNDTPEGQARNRRVELLIEPLVTSPSTDQASG